MEQKVLQPLKLDMGRFKREYKRLASMTTYARAMDKAVDAKADKWLSYTPLSREQLFDTPWLDKPITVLRPMASGNIAPARSTFRGAMQEQLSVFHRPTEALAILHAMGFFIIPSDLEVIRQDPNVDVRWCILCKRVHNVAEFAPNKHFPNGLSFACKRSLAEADRGIWRKTG